MDKEKYIEFLQERLKNEYDMKKEVEYAGEIFDLRAEYHLRNEQYVLSKKNVIYGYELEEFHFVQFVEEDPTEEEFLSLMKRFIESHKELVNFHDEHMATIIYLVFIGNELPNNKKFIKALKNYKKQISSFLGLKGWVDFGVLYYSLKDGDYFANRIGKKTAKLYLVGNQEVSV